MLHTIDWVILIGLTVLIFIVGIAFAKKASKNLNSFFLGNRNLPWYIAGVSMVATTFAADTPLAVTEMVAKNGVSGNWLWWNFLAGGMLTTFFFANLWRRAGVLTEVELIEKRYSGVGAAWLRGFKSIYLGLFINIIIIGWVNLAMLTLLEGFFGIPAEVSIWYLAGLMALVGLFSSLSGFLGVVYTDAIQFVMAMIGTILLAVFVVQSEPIGGLSGLVEQTSDSARSFFPSLSDNSTGTNLAMGIGSFFAYFSIVWWACWYPGAEPGGGGYVAQRMMSTKDEKHAVYATLFFQIAHYCIRPWPWILVALAAGIIYTVPNKIPDTPLKQEIIQFQESNQLDWKYFNQDIETLTKAAEGDVVLSTHLDQTIIYGQQLKKMGKNNVPLGNALRYQSDPRFGYVYAVKDYMPVGLLGLILFAFLAAYISTISTQLNWGASYLTNDLYKRFISPDSSDKNQVIVARLMTLLLMVLGLLITTQMNSISGVWNFLIECGAGLGLVLILRWYWWRINAWTEIAATIAPFIIYAVCHFGFGLPNLGSGDPTCFFITVAGTTIVWITVMLMTPATDEDHLLAFYEQVRPDGAWEPFAHLSNNISKKSNLGNLFACWIAGVTMTYSILFAIGKTLFLSWNQAAFWFTLAIVAFFVLSFFLKRTKILR